MPNTADVAQLLEHDLLQSGLGDAGLQAGCQLAHELGAASVCVKPYAVQSAARLLKESNVRVATIVSWPHGCQETAVKLLEAELALAAGAEEVELVLNRGRIVDENWQSIGNELVAFSELARARQGLMRVQIDLGWMSDAVRSRVLALCAEAETGCITFVIPPTVPGAPPLSPELPVAVAGLGASVHVSGDISRLEQIKELWALGVERIRTTAAAQILQT